MQLEVLPHQDTGDLMRSAFAGCNVTVGCFEFEAGCLARGDCKVIASFNVSSDTKFVLGGADLSDGDYLALELSTHDSMNESLVFYCNKSIDSLSNVNKVNGNIFAAWRLGRNNVTRIDGVQVGFIILDSNKDRPLLGMMHFSFTVPFNINCFMRMPKNENNLEELM